MDAMSEKFVDVNIYLKNLIFLKESSLPVNVTIATGIGVVNTNFISLLSSAGDMAGSQPEHFHSAPPVILEILVADTGNVIAPVATHGHDKVSSVDDTSP